MEKKWKYKISDGYLGTILSFVMLAAFGGLTYWLYATRNGAFLVAMILTTNFNLKNQFMNTRFMC